MTSAIPVSEARAALPALLDRVIAGDEITLTRHGVPVAVIVAPEALALRRADSALRVADLVREALEQARRSPLSERPGLSAKRADEILEGVSAGRKRR